MISARQEWVKAIECISAAGFPLPPLVVFKAKHTNSGEMPLDTPPDWRFSTSNSGWTSDSHAYELLTTLEPSVRPKQSLHFHNTSICHSIKCLKRFPGMAISALFCLTITLQFGVVYHHECSNGYVLRTPDLLSIICVSYPPFNPCIDILILLAPLLLVGKPRFGGACVRLEPVLV